MGTNRPTQMWDLARAVVADRPCPIVACGAGKGELCLNLRNLRALRAGEPDRITLPHAERYPAGNRLIGAPENAALLTR